MAIPPHQPKLWHLTMMNWQTQTLQGQEKFCRHQICMSGYSLLQTFPGQPLRQQILQIYLLMAMAVMWMAITQ